MGKNPTHHLPSTTYQALPLDHVLFLVKLTMFARGEGFSRGTIQQVRRHPGELQKFARTAAASLRHFRQVQKPLLVLQEIGRGLQYS